MVIRKGPGSLKMLQSIGASGRVLGDSRGHSRAGGRAPVRSGRDPHSEALPSPALCRHHPQTLDTNSEREAPYLRSVLPIYFLIRERLVFPLTRSLIIIQPVLLTQELRFLFSLTAY